MKSKLSSSLTTRITAVLIAPAMAALLVGCKVGPAYRAPTITMPSSYNQDTVVSSNRPAADLARWWTVFNDTELNTLVNEAAPANHDVRLAKARVREARALRGVSRSALFPQAEAGGDYSRSRLSEHTPNGRLARAAGEPPETDSFNTAVDMNWEIDVFGGNRRAVEAAQANLEAAEETGREVLVSVLAEVGLSYLDLRGFQKQLAVARDNLRAQEQTLALTQDRLNAGLTSQLDVTRAEAQAAHTSSEIPPLEQGRERAIYRLGVLLGRAPADLESRLRPPAPLPSAAPGVPVGLPSDLLRRRPDIRRAEREVAAATARVGVATAELFPRFFLTGAAGLQSLESSDFFDAGSRFWSLGPSLRWPIFTAGRIRQKIRVENARQEQTLHRHEKTVLIPLEEVQNAPLAFGK